MDGVPPHLITCSQDRGFRQNVPNLGVQVVYVTDTLELDQLAKIYHYYRWSLPTKNPNLLNYVGFVTCTLAIYNH